MTEQNHSGSSDPAVAVVIPTYNRNSKLQRAVDSVLRQTYENWKLYVVNDAPENSIQDVIPDDDRIERIQHDENKGAPAARNTGIRMSNAPYIAFLDDDDAWKPEKLERQIDVFKRLAQDYGLVYSGYDKIQDDKLVKTEQPKLTGDVFNELLRKNFIPSNTPVIRRECIKKVGDFDTKLESSQDIDLWLRITRLYKVSVISDSLAVAYKGHEDRISKNMERKYQGKKRLLNKYWDDLVENPVAVASHLKSLSVYAMHTNRQTEARKYLISSFRYKKKQFTIVYYITASFCPDPIQKIMLDYRNNIPIT